MHNLRFSNDVRTVELAGGHVAIVDVGDFERVSQWKWHARRDRNTFYAYRTVVRSVAGDSRVRGSVAMHRLILGLDFGDTRIVDHRDGNGLNNTRSNLRICDAKRNAFNNKRQLPKSGFRGVHFDRSNGVWVAQTRINGRKFHIGTFGTPEEAGRAYDATVKSAAGEFAVTNEMMGAFHATI